MSYVDLVTHIDGHCIPEAKYIDDIEKFVGDRNPITTTNAAKEILAKYRFMEKSMISKLTTLLDKLPELKDALSTLERLRKGTADGSDIQTYFKVSDTLYAEAQIPRTDLTFLWLGANTMVEYPIDEAVELLTEQHKIALDSVEEIKKELEWIRIQITSMEITVARLHNYCVVRNSKEATK